jgi:hypothetical protein
MIGVMINISGPEPLVMAAVADIAPNNQPDPRRLADLEPGCLEADNAVYTEESGTAWTMPNGGISFPSGVHLVGRGETGNKALCTHVMCSVTFPSSDGPCRPVARILSARHPRVRVVLRWEDDDTLAYGRARYSKGEQIFHQVVKETRTGPRRAC